MTIQDRPDRLGQPEVRAKSSRTVKLRRNGKLVPNFSAIQRLVVEVEAPENVTYEIPFNNMTAIMADEPFLLTKLRPFTQYRYRNANRSLKVELSPMNVRPFVLIHSFV